VENVDVEIGSLTYQKQTEAHADTKKIIPPAQYEVINNGI